MYMYIQISVYCSSVLPLSLQTEYAEAVQCYTEALKQYPPSSAHEVAVCHANRAACHLKLVYHVLYNIIPTF